MTMTMSKRKLEDEGKEYPRIMVGGLILEWYKMSGFLPSRKNVKSRLFDNWRFRPGLKMLASNSRWRWVLC